MNPSNSSDMTADPWEVEGRRLAPQLDGICAVIIASADPRIAPRVALGIARTLGAHRRVAIADLIGESPVLEAIRDGDDPHGLSDSFQYGVSLNKIARPVHGTDNVFVMPSGTEPVDHEGIYANERWRRLAAGFHQVGALLIVVARPGTNGFADLCGFIGALMPVGEAAFPLPPGIPIIAPTPVEPARASAARALSNDESSTAAHDDDEDEAPIARGPRKRPRTMRARERAEESSGGQQRKLFAMLTVGAALVVAGVALWPQLSRQLTGARAATADSTAVVVLPTPMDSIARADSALKAPAAVDSLGALQGGDSLAAAAAAPLEIANPSDSASAARYAVYFSTANTRAAALPDERVKALAAVALTMVPEGTERWFRLTIGAHASRADADALLARLRTDKIISAGSILSVPLALRLEEKVPAATVATRLTALRDRGIMAYALRQSDGSATLYTGAFESPAQATALADSLRGVGITPALAYRLGRAF